MDLKELNIASTNAIHEKEDKNVYYDSWENLKIKVKQMAEIIKRAKDNGDTVVIYTGAV
jgi:hypothetical protein